MHKPTSFRLGLTGFVLALVTAGCGNGDASPSTTDDPTTTTVAPPTTGGPATTVAVGGDEDELSGLLAQYEMIPLRTTYVFRDGGEETVVTLSQDPTQNPPVEAVIIEEAGSKLITMGEQSVFCDTTTNQCFSVPGAGGGSSAGLLGPFAGGLFLAADFDDISDAQKSEDTAEIAGRSGVCFTFMPPPETGFDTEAVRQCIDSELGFTLLIQAQKTDGRLETVMELVEFGDPLDDDFTPTGPVSESP